MVNVSEEIGKFWIACVLISVEQIHNKEILHRDLKPENLLLDADGYMRVTDFGISENLKKRPSFDTSGTPGYMPPEALNGKK